MKILRYISIALTALAVTSCTDLDTDVKSQFTTDNFPTTTADMEAVCGPAYTTFKACYGRQFWMVQEMSGDACFMACNGDNWYDKASYLQYDLHTWATDNGNNSTIWWALFGAISKCNQILSILDAAPSTPLRDQSIAQIRAMRALYVFWATDNFGAIPLVTKFGDVADSRTPRPQVAEWIANELKEVLPSLPANVDASTYGKPTRYMAEALLAKLYLNWGVYSLDDVTTYDPRTASNPHLNDVVAYCDDIIKSGIYNLSDDWIKKFDYDNGVQIKDFILAFSYNWSTDNEDLGGNGNQHYRFWGNPRFGTILGTKKNPSGPMRAYGEYVDKFNLPGDERNRIWYGGVLKVVSTGNPLVLKVTKSSLDQYYQGADKDATVDWTFKLTKYPVIRGTGSQYTNNLNRIDLGNDELGRAMGYRDLKFLPNPNATVHFQDNDVPVLRYADVLLMKAEAILRGATATNGDTPLSLLNQIRTCAKAPLATSVNLDDLLDERAREFSDEGWRRNDLIRFGRFEDDWGFKSAKYGMSNKDKYRRIFPIPFDARQADKTLTQNPGYPND